MTDPTKPSRCKERNNWAELRAALDADPKDDKWMCVKYSPKTLGVGISGGPALFMVREGSYTDIDDVRDIVGNLLAVRNRARALLADYSRLRKFIENEAVKAERGGRVSLAKRCRAALAQEQP